MKRVSVRGIPASSLWPFPIELQPAPVVFVDHEDGSGWRSEDGAPLDEQMSLMAEICYLNSGADQESVERAKLLFDVWCISKQLTTSSLEALAATAMTLRG
jgi:hypothetical protein